jgi:pyrimidine deaminase RibD-like protein
MRANEFQITKLDKLDNILVELCSDIIIGQKKDPDYYGMVAACVLDMDNNIVTAVNYFKDGKRVHAERAAIEKYHSQYGDIPAGSIIVTTLSPCSEEMAERYGDSCTKLIEDIGVHKVYCGYKDPTQSDSGSYLDKTFHVMETKNEKLRELCKSFADTFLDKELHEAPKDVFHFVGHSTNVPKPSGNYYKWRVSLSNGQHYDIRAGAYTELEKFQQYFLRKWGHEMPNVEVINAERLERLNERQVK